MALHGRYTNSLANERRVPVKFRRLDLLWKTNRTLVPPQGGPGVHGLPIRVTSVDAVGPTILDMMVRQVVPLTDELRERLALTLPEETEEIAIWEQRKVSALWPRPVTVAAPKKEPGQGSMLLDHPFQRGLASGGEIRAEDSEFVTVEKLSTISISEMALRLAVGMAGDIGTAYTNIGTMAAERWAADVQRARALWNRIQDAGMLYEDATIAALRPTSSISQEIEQLILRQACTWLGVDPALDFSRPRGRPSRVGATSGDIINVTVSKDGHLRGVVMVDFHGLLRGTKLEELGVMVLVDLLGALRLAQHEFDVDLLEAFLDAAAPDWRDQATSAASEPQAGGDGHDPYEVLGVPRDASMEDVTRAYRKIMQRVHPDVSNLGPWFAQVVASAYRSIRQERGEQ